MLSNFKKNKKYLNKYYYIVISVLSVLDFLIWYINPPDLNIGLLFIPAFGLLIIPNIYFIISGWLYALIVCLAQTGFSMLYVLEILLAVVCTFTATAFLHNASHSTMKPSWLNRVVGEVMALFQLVGLPDWTIIHILHHQHPDDPKLDPHPPLDKSYWQFLLGMRKSIAKVLGTYYCQLWGNNQESVNNLKMLGNQIKLTSLLKILFWYLLFGPQTFTFFFAFSFVFKTLHYAWFNYATHLFTQNGVSIINLNQGFYKFINFVAFGLYYHKNHHLRPGLFNPSKLISKT